MIAPNPLVPMTAHLVPPGTVLELGITQGQNMVYFAQQGRVVVGYDPDPQHVERINRMATDSKLKMSAEIADYTSLSIDEQSVALIIVIDVLNFLDDSQVNIVVREILRALQPGGLVIVQAISTADEISRVLPEGKNVKNRFMTADLRRLFSQLNTVMASSLLLRADCLRTARELPPMKYRGTSCYVGQKNKWDKG